MVLILLGAPGAGKGTQAEYLTEALKIPVIGTGNLLRQAVASGSALGLQVKSCMEQGRLVPDEVVVDLVLERLKTPECAHGAILDGFPRTLPQAQALDAAQPSVTAMSIEVPDELIVDRMGGRRACTRCGATYHVTNQPPKTEGICDKCGGPLSVRKDDAPETVRERLELYHRETETLKDHYAQQGRLILVDGTGDVQTVRERVLSAAGVLA